MASVRVGRDLVMERPKVEDQVSRTRDMINYPIVYYVMTKPHARS